MSMPFLYAKTVTGFAKQVREEQALSCETSKNAIKILSGDNVPCAEADVTDAHNSASECLLLLRGVSTNVQNGFWLVLINPGHGSCCPIYLSCCLCFRRYFNYVPSYLTYVYSSVIQTSYTYCKDLAAMHIRYGTGPVSKSDPSSTRFRGPA